MGRHAVNTAKAGWAHIDLEQAGIPLNNLLGDFRNGGWERNHPPYKVRNGKISQVAAVLWCGNKYNTFDFRHGGGKKSLFQKLPCAGGKMQTGERVGCQAIPQCVMRINGQHFGQKPPLTMPDQGNAAKSWVSLCAAKILNGAA